VRLKCRLAAVVVLFALGGADLSWANQINTGEADGIIQAKFCPALAEHLARAELKYACAPSPGTADNVQRVVAAPAELGYGQLDIFARDVAKLESPESVIPIRTDDVRQCLFAVTRHREVQKFGELSVLAPHLKFVLPPQSSSSAGTFEILQRIDMDGVGRAKSLEYAGSAEEAIRKALSAEDSVAFFVQFPDPGDKHFALVQELGGHYVPIIDREILRLVIDGQKVYFAQETQVSNADWLTRSQKVVTACTPVVLFTGSPTKIADAKARQDHEDMVATIRALRAEALLPQDSAFARVLSRTKELSASSAEQLMRASERARERAQPYIEGAKEATDKALDAARPALERAKEYGLKAYEKAREEFKGLTEPRPEETPAEQPKQ